MKKFISAASAVAMVASLVGSAVPFSTVAAEASKTIELRPFTAKDGSAVSTTISAADIAAGDVTIPVGVYFGEKVNDTKTIRMSFGVSSKDGDASNKYVTFGHDERVPYKPNDEFFSSPVTVTDKAGKTYEYSKIVGFAGTMTSGRNGARFNASGEYVCNLANKQNSQNWTTAWGSFVWTRPVTGGYEWTGATSDAYPCYVFDVNFAKGTPAGTYTIDFIDMVPDPAFPLINATMIESNEGGGVYRISDGNITAKGITFTIEGTPSATTPPATTTTKAPATTTKAPATTTVPVSTPGAPTTTKPGSSSGDVQADFIVKGAEVKYDPTKDTYMDFYVESNGHKAATLVFEVAEPLPAGITFEMTEAVNYAIPGEPGWTLMNRTYKSECRDAKEHPQSFIDGESVCNIQLTVPANIADGTYEIGLERFHVVEQASEKVGPIIEFNATVIPGKLIVGTPGTPAVTTAPGGTTAPVATTTKPVSSSGNVQADFIVKGAEVKYDPTKDTYMDFFVESNGHKAATIVFEVAEPLPAGITFEMTEAVNYAIPGEPGWTLMNRTYKSECRDAKEHPQSFIDGESVCNIQLTVPANIADGTYEIGLERFHVVEQASEKVGPIVEFNATVIPGKLIVGNGGTPVTTTAPTTPPVATPTTTTPAPGNVLYGDANCNGKVDIADVVVLNKWLNDNSAYAMTAQGKINADCCDPKAGTPDENDSKAIIQSLVHLNNGKALPWTAADLK